VWHLFQKLVWHLFSSLENSEIASSVRFLRLRKTTMLPWLLACAEIAYSARIIIWTHLRAVNGPEGNKTKSCLLMTPSASYRTLSPYQLQSTRPHSDVRFNSRTVAGLHGTREPQLRFKTCGLLQRLAVLVESTPRWLCFQRETYSRRPSSIFPTKMNRTSVPT
jgi:hypothetical protein